MSFLRHTSTYCASIVVIKVICLVAGLSWHSSAILLCPQLLFSLVHKCKSWYHRACIVHAHTHKPLYPRRFRTTWCSWANCCWQVTSFSAAGATRCRVV